MRQIPDWDIILRQKGTGFRMHFEYQLMWPSPGVIIEGGEKRLSRWATSHQSIWGEKIHEQLEKYELVKSEPEEGQSVTLIRTRLKKVVIS